MIPSDEVMMVLRVLTKQPLLTIQPLLRDYLLRWVIQELSSFHQMESRGFLVLQEHQAISGE